MLLQKDDNGTAIQALRPGPVQRLILWATAQATLPAAKDRIVRLYATADCHLAVGISATATSNATTLPAGTVEYFSQSKDTRVSVIAPASGGTLEITEML